MTAFLKKVEGYVRKDGSYVPDKGEKTVHKPKKARKAKKVKNSKRGLIAPFKPNKATKARKARKFEKTVKPGSATGYAPVKKTNTNFSHLRRYMDEFEQLIQNADPFDESDPSWLRFLRDVAPKLLVMVLWDTGHVTESKDRAQLIKMFRQHIRT